MLTVLTLAALAQLADISFEVFEINGLYVVNVTVDDPSEFKILILDGCGSSTALSRGVLLKLCKNSKALFLYEGWKGAASCSDGRCCVVAIKRAGGGFVIKAFGRGDLLISGVGVVFLKGKVKEKCIKKREEVVYVPKCRKTACAKSAPVGELECKEKSGKGWLVRSCKAKRVCLERNCVEWASYPVRLSFCEVVKRDLFIFNPTPSSSLLLIKLKGETVTFLPAKVKGSPYVLTAYSGGSPCASFVWR